MNKIAIVTDSNSGMKQEMVQDQGIYIVPMPFTIEGETYFEGVNLSKEEFFANMEEGKDIKTSQPLPGDVLDLWEKLLTEYDEIVHIPMSSGLSSACATAISLADDFDGRVQVVDNQRISVTQKAAVYDAKALAESGKNAVEIKEILEKEKFEASIYIILDTLQYLKKGGRITPAAAALGTMLNIKPVLQIQGERLDSFAKVRGEKKAKRTMIEAIKKDLDTRFKEASQKGNVVLAGAYTGSEEKAEEWKHELKEQFPGFDIEIDPLSLSIATHIGPGSLAVAISKKVTV